MIDDGNLTEQRGSVTRALDLLASGIVEAFGLPLAAMGTVALALIVVRRRDPVLAMAVVLAGPALVTFTAYLAGHPTKTRYALLLSPPWPSPWPRSRAKGGSRRWPRWRWPRCSSWKRRRRCR